MNKYEMVEIKELLKEKFDGVVYDIEVKEDHSYTVNDIAVHNSACMTRRFTGVGAPQLWVMEQARDEVIKQGLKVKLVSDGGVRYTSDINKAMKFSDAVMVGKFVAGTAETPGAVYQNPKGEFYKVYAGSASGENKTSNGQSTDFTEGITMEVPFRGKVKYIFRNIKQGMQSGFSLAGSMSLKEFQEKCEFNFITDGGREESKI
jgi:IMP dehydrogenase/GMP reductase